MVIFCLNYLSSQSFDKISVREDVIMLVLVLSDDQNLLKIFSSITAQGGKKFLFVKTTKEVKDKMAQADLLFFDVDSDAILVSKVQEQCVGQGKFKTIVCSFDSKKKSEFRKNQCRQNLVDGYLQKPLSAEIVAGVIADFENMPERQVEIESNDHEMKTDLSFADFELNDLKLDK